MRQRAIFASVLLLAGTLCATAPAHTWIVTEDPLTPDQVEQLDSANSLLLMVPGISSGDLKESRIFLERIREEGGYELAVFYDWQADNPTRIVVSRTATEPAARHLVEFCAQYQRDKTGRAIDVIAHSAGSVVLNKGAQEIVQGDLPLRFRHVLLLGTALDADESLDNLKVVSSSILNLHSAFDKVNHNINDRNGLLAELDGPPYSNLQKDYSLGGRMMRHYVFLASNPENRIGYSAYLTTGTWPAAEPPAAGTKASLIDLQRTAQWVRVHPEETNAITDRQIRDLLKCPDPDRQYYGAIFVNLLGKRQFTDELRTMLSNEDTPAYVRKEIYQALGSFEDPDLVRFLRRAVRRDAECSEELRDIVRDLKRKRIRPSR